MQMRSMRGSSVHFPDISSRGTARARSRDCAFSSARYDFFGPRANGLVDRIELFREEVIRAGDDDTLGVAHLRDELLEFVDRSVLVFSAVQEKNRPLARAQVTEIVFVERRADQKNPFDFRKLARHPRGNPRAE